MEKGRRTVLQERIERRLKALGDAKAAAQSKAAGLSDSFIRDIKRGKTVSPRAENLQKLAQALETTTDYLQGKTDDPAVEPQPLSARMRRIMAAFDLLDEDVQEVALNRVLALVPAKSAQSVKDSPEEDGK